MNRIVLSSLALAACSQPMTAEEQVETVDIQAETARMDAATDDIVEVSTSFTLGDAVEAAAEKLRAFWASQAPCATVTREAGAITVDFGTTAGCTWNSRSWTGTLIVAIDRSEPGEAVVTHTWDGLSNGIGTLDGTASVTWSSAEGSRNVVIDATWVGPEHTLDVTSDRTWTRLVPGGGPGSGVKMSGERTWTVDGAATWTQDIDGLEMRAIDPAPQAGSVVWTSPAGRTLTLTFTRIDDDTIEITAEARRTRTWRVTASGTTEV
jgi:hypothetical protein